MDPFAERMLKRAKARRDKLEAEAQSVGVTITHTITPLLEMDQAYNVNKGLSPRKTQFSPKKAVLSPSPAKPVRASPLKLNREPSIHSPRNAVTPQLMSSDEDDENDFVQARRSNSTKLNEREDVFNKENGENASEYGLRDGMRSRLKRLGALYSETGELSSPISRTESDFCVESAEPKPSARPTARMARLAALASSINEWEDDLSHSSAGCRTKTEERERPRNEFSVRLAEKKPAPGRAGPGASRFSVMRPNTKPEESQGFARSESRSRLYYDFEKDDDFKDGSPEKLASLLEERSSPMRNTSPAKAITPTKRQSPAPCSPQKSVARLGFSSPAKESPQSFRGALKTVGGVDSSPSECSVLQRAAQYEAAASPTQKPFKDPAELPLHERMALFEKNKGPLLVPKVPFSSPMPAKLIQDKGKSSPQKSSCPPIKEPLVNVASLGARASPQKSTPAASLKPNKVLAKLQMFETGQVQTTEMSPSRPQNQAILERQREMDQLANRWNKNKEMSGASSSPVPAPPPLPPASRNSADRRSPVRVAGMTIKSNAAGTPPPPPPMPGSPMAKSQPSPKKSPMFREPKDYPGLSGVKRLKASPPKPGQLYPSLSDVEATTETESYTSNNSSMTESESYSDLSPAECSFGRDLLEVAQKVGSAHKSVKKARFETSDSDVSLTESNVLDDIDDYLDEAMAGHESPDVSDSEGPLPSKRSRDFGGYGGSRSKGNSPAQNRGRMGSPRSPYSAPSPKKSFPSPRRKISPLKSSSPDDLTSQDEEFQQPKLMHTVSFYRKQQNARGTPVRQIVRHPTPEKVFGTSSSSDSESCAETVDEGTLVKDRIKELRSELDRQRTLIDQTSKYLNVCLNTVEFPNFDGRVESERLLLMATHTHRAVQSEVTRLEVERTIRPKGQGGRTTFHSAERGKLHIEEITVPLKRDFILSLTADDHCHHFIGLVRCNEQVLATPVASVEQGKGVQQDPSMGSVIRFKKELVLSNLYSNFTVTVEVYTMRTRKEKSGHDSKFYSKKDSSKHRSTPKKSKHDSIFVKPPLQSPAGPMAVRASQFKMIGYVVFSLKEIQRTQFTLTKVAQDGSIMCPLTGSIHLKLQSDLSLNIEEKGFLTMFEDVSGLGAWHRRWCVLKGEHLSYWKYPDDVSRKIAIGSIDLRSCTTDVVGPVPRDICARLNTFLLETMRPAREDDKDTLVVVRKGSKTIIRHLLSADDKEERIQWCNSLNKALSLMRAWGKV